MDEKQIAAERGAFEAWAVTMPARDYRKWPIRRNAVGQYRAGYVQDAWIVWLARAAAAHAERERLREAEDSVAWLLHQMRHRDLQTLRSIGETYPTDDATQGSEDEPDGGLSRVLARMPKFTRCRVERFFERQACAFTLAEARTVDEREWDVGKNVARKSRADWERALQEHDAELAAGGEGEKP